MKCPDVEWREVSGRTAGEPRVLIVRLSAVGDCIQTLPLAAAVRRNWPAAHITWAVERSSADLVAAATAVDELLVLPRGFAKSPRILWAIRRALWGRRFDVALDPQGLTKSSLVGWLSGARRRIGFARPTGREIGPWLQTELVRSLKLHRVERYLELLGPLGVQGGPVEFGLRIPEPAQHVVERLAVARRETRPHETCANYVALNPGAGWHSKRWPVERFAEVARHMAMRGMDSIVTWGGAREQKLAEEIAQRAGGAATIAPPTTLLELAALLQGARFVVGSDTGPIHLAAAVGTPCLALFGSSLAEGCGPYGTGHVCLQAAYDESPGRKRPGADNWAMRMIDVRMVCDACDVMLERGKVAAAA